MWIIAVFYLAFVFYLAYRGKKMCDEWRGKDVEETEKNNLDDE